jgi:3-hydroxyacyl-CoA dehydrogenase
LTLGYAAHLVGGAAPDIVAVDTAMRLAWDWRDGPFALADRLGIDRVAGLLAAGDVAPAPILAAAAGRPLYRRAGRRPQFLDLSGDYRDVAASAVTAPKT